MITNFKEITIELTEDETKLLPMLIEAFKKYNKSKPIKAPEIVIGINAYCKKNAINYTATEVRLRKMVNYIRTNGLLPLIATSNGYFVSFDKSDIESQITSLSERASSIMGCAKGLTKFLQ